MVTDSSRIITGLPALPSDSLPKEIYSDILLIHNAIRNVQTGVSRYCGIDSQPTDLWSQIGYADTVLTGNLTRLYPVAAVAIAAGQVINLFSNGGVLGARLASASSSTTMAHGIANTTCAAGQRFEMQFLRSLVTSISGMIVGNVYYLGVTAGAIQNLPPTVAGTIAQPVGLAATSSILIMDIPLSFKQN